MLSTLRAYFEGKKELFKGLKIETLEKEWMQHKVFHFDFNGVNFTEPGTLTMKIEGYLHMWEKEFGITPEVDFNLGSRFAQILKTAAEQTGRGAGTLTMKIEGYLHMWEKEFGITPEVDFNLGSRFAQILKTAAEQTGRGAVVLVDEYDKPLLDVMEQNQEFLEQNREILKAFYSVFKQADAHLRFVFLTGVTKFSQVSVFSGFNQPLDISMTSRYDTLWEQNQEILEQTREILKAFYSEYKQTDAYLRFVLHTGVTKF